MIRLVTFLVAGFVVLAGCQGQPDTAKVMDPNQSTQSDSQNAQNFNYTEDKQKDGDNQYF